MDEESMRAEIETAYAMTERAMARALNAEARLAVIEARGIFIPPSEEDVALQAAKIGMSDVEMKKFLAHYGSNGWLVGKNKMTSWRHAMSGWNLRTTQSQSRPPRDHSQQGDEL